MNLPTPVPCITAHFPQVWIPHEDRTTCRCGARTWPGDAREFNALSSQPIALPSKAGA